MIKKKKIKEEHQEEVTAQVETYQEELANNDNNNKRKRGSGIQKKLNIGLSYQNRCFYSMSNYFIHASSHPSFRAFRDPYFMTMTSIVAGANDFKL